MTSTNISVGAPFRANRMSRKSSEFWKKANRFRPGGIFRESGQRAEIALIVARGGAGEYRIVYHEYFHHLVNMNNPGIPSWLNEGLASYWENTTIDDGRIVRSGGKELALELEEKGYGWIEKERAPSQTAEAV